MKTEPLQPGDLCQWRTIFNELFTGRFTKQEGGQAHVTRKDGTPVTLDAIRLHKVKS